jgi:hypothetical protein
LVDFNPWNQINNQRALNTIFGAGNWNQSNYSTPASTIFNPSNSFVMIEGGDENSTFPSYISTNQTLIENWVSNGGKLLVKVAPNYWSGATFDLGFSGTQIVQNYIVSVSLTLQGISTIGVGPTLPTISGSNYTDLIVSDDLPTIGSSVLSFKRFGSGFVTISTATEPTFHQPQVNGENQNLLNNIIYFAYSVVPLSQISITAPPAALTSNCTVLAPSAPTTFDVTGSNLSSTVTVSATTGFEISASQNSAYFSSLSLTPDGSGTVSSTLYVRLTASSGGGISGTITASSTGATTQTTTVSSTTVAPPAFSPAGPFNICAEASYLVALATPNSYNGWSSSDANVFSVNSTGYITNLASGTASITYTDACGQSTSQTVTVQTPAPSLPITDTRVAFKFNGSPQGPTLSGSTINYIGYDGYTYFSQTPPTNVGFYKANIQSGTNAGCPNRFYIFTCTTCNN